METLSYTYDAMSRRTSETRTSGGLRTFGYDATGQLLQVTHSGGSATFSYDAVGNRTSVAGASGAGSYAANALNQYTTAGGVGALTYDANGNLATGGGWTYTHNGDSRLTGVSGPANATFGRDARNREVKRTINGTTTYLVYDGWNLVAEYDASGTLATQYIHGPRVDEVLAKVTSSGTTYPLEDALGSTIAVTNATGTVLERITYTDAFGTPEFQDAAGSPLPGTTTGTRFLFTGREYLAPLGLYDYRNRTYSPSLGRFIQTDPIRFDAGDVNLYRYGMNNSATFLDPFGLQSCSSKDDVGKRKDLKYSTEFTAAGSDPDKEKLKKMFDRSVGRGMASGVTKAFVGVQQLFGSAGANVTLWIMGSFQECICKEGSFQWEKRAVGPDDLGDYWINNPADQQGMKGAIDSWVKQIGAS